MLLFCSVYAKIQELEQASVLQRIQYTQKSRSSGRLLFCSVYSIRKNPGAQAGPCPAAYTQNPGAGQGSAQQRIRKIPGSQAGQCPAAYTQKSRNSSRLLFCSVYSIRKNPGAQAGPDSVYLCESASITKKPGREDLLPGFLW